MKVTLFDYTGAGNLDPASYAASILIYTKTTRLEMSPGLIRAIKDSSYEDKLIHLKEMSNTNPGSWEFIHFSFLIEGVTRAFTEQLTRTRTASYAQQTLRMVNISEQFKYLIGPSVESNATHKAIFIEAMDNIIRIYKSLIDHGARVEDARGILPLNTLTNTNMCINMRNFINMCRKRQSLRVQDEYRKVVDLMIIEAEKVYPWFYLFYKNDEMKAFKDLSIMIEESKGLTPEEKTAIYKKLDIIKGEI